MRIFNDLKSRWLFNSKNDILAGITVAFALIPEAIAFSIIAGVDPMVGLYASFFIAVLISFVGGRPGMISAATGAMALLMGGLVAKYGVEFLFAATIVTGVIQYLLGLLKIGKYISFMPHSVLTGFVNALAILIFMAQLPHFIGQGWLMYAMVAGTLLIIYGLPRLTKVVPSALVAIIFMTILAIIGDFKLNTVGDMGGISTALPVFHLPLAPLAIETLWIVLPTSIALAFVGIIESLLTAKIVDDLTDTQSDKNVEIRGQGIANFVTGFFGGMAGCAMIGQSVINVKSGGRGRLSTFVAGIFLLVLIIFLGDVVRQIPMAALVGVMIMVSIGTFDWKYLRNLNTTFPKRDSIVMLVTVGIVVFTHNLALGVAIGVILSAVIFGWQISRMHSEIRMKEDGTKVYIIKGQLFFGTMSHFVEQFDFVNDPDKIEIDFSYSHIWDHSAVTAIASAIEKYEGLNKQVIITETNEESNRMIARTGLERRSTH
jgi:SulP family sulfate permease